MVPLLLSVRSSPLVPEPLIVEASPATLVVPVPLIVPALQPRSPLALTVAEPLKVPPERLSNEVLAAELKLAVPPLTNVVPDTL